MDDNTKVIIIKGIEVAKDIFLVIAGALATYLAEKALFNRRNKREAERKEEEIIIEAVSFTNHWTDQVIKFQTNQDYRELERNLDEGFFPKLKLISFQLRRLQDKGIWEKFEKSFNLSIDFSDFLQKINMGTEGADIQKLNETQEKWKNAEKEFADYCIAYLKIKK